MKVFLFIIAGILVTTLMVVFTTTSDLEPALLQKAILEYNLNQKRIRNKRYLTIIDYRKNIFQTRLWVYDNQSRSVVLSTRVSHAFNSGLLYPTKFSNDNGSELSSLGVFITGESYEKGNFGYSMRVDGITPSLNTNARVRAIVFHTDPGYRFSKGCFMTSRDVNRRLIDLIKNKSLVCIYK